MVCNMLDSGCWSNTEIMRAISVCDVQLGLEIETSVSQCSAYVACVSVVLHREVLNSKMQQLV